MQATRDVLHDLYWAVWHKGISKLDTLVMAMDAGGEITRDDLITIRADLCVATDETKDLMVAEWNGEVKAKR